LTIGEELDDRLRRHGPIFGPGAAGPNPRLIAGMTR